MYLSKLMRTALVAVLAAGCTPRAKPLSADHPANPDAEPGRLVGAPPALDPSAPAAPAPPAPPAHPPGHEGHH